MSKFTIRPYEPGDEAALLDLHNRAYSQHAPRSRRHWEWKFRGNPSGHLDILVGESEGGDLAGVWAGVTLRFLLDHEPCAAILQLDVATDPALRSGLAGGARLASLGRQYFAAHFRGATKMAWGFPEPPLHRLGLRLLKFEVLRDVIFLVRDPTPAAPPPSAVEVRDVARFGDDADELWNTCAPELGTAVVRDARYLNWRYADHPDHPHLLLEARDARTGTLRGLATAREGGWNPALLSMMDWLVPAEDREAERALVHRVVAEAAARDRQYVACWFPAPSPQFARFQLDHSFFAQATPYQACFRPRGKERDRRWYERHWYQTMGDIDFF